VTLLLQADVSEQLWFCAKLAELYRFTESDELEVPRVQEFSAIFEEFLPRMTMLELEEP
jgi:hypothetical protein